MVFAFLCHTVTSTPCRLLHSVVYGEDLTGTVKKTTSADRLRHIRKEQLMEVVCRVQAERGFRDEAKDRVPKGSIVREETGTTYDSLPVYEKGYIHLAKKEPFPESKYVLWMICDGIAFVMVLESDENRLLSEIVLTLIAKLSHDYCMSLEQKGAEVLLKAERISTILQIVLPNGQLNFMNHKVIKQLEKQVDGILSK